MHMYYATCSLLCPFVQLVLHNNEKICSPPTTKIVYDMFLHLENWKIGRNALKCLLYFTWKCWANAHFLLISFGIRESDSKPGSGHLGVLGEQKCVFQLFLLKYIFTNYLDNRNKSYNSCETPRQAFRGKLWQTSSFWKAAFREKKQIWFNGK